ncbi:MAG: benzoate-CoA ligase family protein [Thermoguttaceae bacterium]|jgi:benzoate-CoA ligase
MLPAALPDRLNAATVLVDVHMTEGRADKAAILCGHQTVSYRQLYEGVNRFGNVLLELGVRREERVALLLPDAPEWVLAFFGAMKIGAVAVPLNTLLTPNDYEYLLHDSGARVLVVHDSLLGPIGAISERLRHLEHLIIAPGEEKRGQSPFAGTARDQRSAGARLSTNGDCPLFSAGPLSLDELMARASPSLEPADTGKDDMAFWLYSSGTTGSPKAAIHRHRDMIVAADQYARMTIALEESDLSFSVAKLFFAYGLGNGLYFPLRTGGTTVLLSDRPVPEKVFEVIDRYQPTVFYGVPTSYAALLHAAQRSGRTSLGRVRMCISAGETLPRHIFLRWRERFKVDILDGIGSTEILHIFISNRPGEAKAGSTGQLVPGYEGRIVDDEGRDLPAGQVGTLWIRGESIAAGYWNKPEATERTFRGEWIDTHDKFMVDQDGFFWYAGRADDMLKVSGQAVWPTEVEGILQGHPAVLESGVTGAADDEGLLKPVAFVVLKDGQVGSPELAHDLQEFVKRNAAPHKYPRAVVFLDALPKTATGKIKRFELRDRAAADGVLRAN